MRSGWRIGATLVAAAIVAFAPAGPALAHASLVSSTPAEGASIASPHSISLQFDDVVQLVPQALVLTAIVIGFATTALFLLVLLALRGLADSDHVDGQEERS